MMTLNDEIKKIESIKKFKEPLKKIITPKENSLIKQSQHTKMILTIILKNHIEKTDFDDKLKHFNRKLLQRQQDM